MQTEEVWRFEAFGIYVGAAGFESADVDGDGVPELVAGSYDFDASQRPMEYLYEAINRYWMVVDASSGFTIEWASPSYPSLVQSVRVQDIDGDGADEVLIGAGSTLEVWEWRNGAMERTLSLPTLAQEVRGITHADVDGDSVTEWVFCDADDLFVYDAETGALELQAVGYGGFDTAAGDVDGDGAVEIVVGGDPWEGTSGVGGHVLDGATGALEWTDPRRFGRRVATADVDGVDGQDEIVAWWGYDFGLAVIDGVTQVSRWETPGSWPEVKDAVILDTDGDGQLEIVYPDDANLLIRYHDAATGFEEISISVPDLSTLGLAIADFQGSSDLDVVWYESTLYGPYDRLRLFDFPSDLFLFETEDLRGPYYGLATGMLDGQPRLVHSVYQGPGGYESGRYQVRALDGTLISTTEADPLSGAGLWRVRVGDLASQPGDEVALTATTIGIYGFGMRDASGDEFWRQSVTAGEAQGLALGDVDADGAVEVVGTTGRDFFVQGEVMVFDGESGAFENSVADLWTPDSDMTLLRLGQLDADPALEIVVAEEGGDVTLLDGVTLAVESATFDLLITALDLVDVDGDSLLDPVVGTSTGDILRIDPVSGAVASILGTWTGPIHGLDAVDVDGDGDDDLVFVANGVPTAIDAGTGTVLWTGPDLGADAGRHDSLLAGDFDSDSRAEVWINRGARGMVLYELTPVVGTVPEMTIYEPAPGSVAYCYLQPWGCYVSFSGDSTDVEDGWLPDSSVLWRSDLEGVLTTGYDYYDQLTIAGTHAITLEGTDSDGNVGVAGFDFQVLVENFEAPVLTITQPADGATFLLGEQVQIVGSALDAEAGDLSPNIWWSIQPTFRWYGEGGAPVLDTSQIGLGTHVLEASVYDADLWSTASITIEVVADGPSVTILEPADGTTILEGTSLTFRATATDNQDGELSSGLSWVSDQQGTIGTGTEITVSDLVPGQHQIQASVTDLDGNPGTAQLSVTVTPNTPPAVAILSPNDLDVFVDGDLITFVGDASDAEDGDLTAQIAWWSSSIGDLGTGASITTTLPIGTLQAVRATVTDAQGVSRVDEIRVDIVPNQVPTVAISSPADGTTVVEGTAVTLAGSASDVEDGDLTASLVWSSELDGVYGTGGSLTVTPSVGLHTIRAGATDSKGAEGFHQVSLRVLANTPPPVSITSPPPGTSVVEGTSVTFAAVAPDTEDGDLSASITWTSNLDGVIGTGGSVATSSLSVGSHEVTASVTDSHGTSGSETVTVTITANTPPTVEILAPATGLSVVEGTSVSFTGSATDIEDGELTSSLAWTSSLDGALGTGASVATSSLSVGSHVITASVTDSHGAPALASITLTVQPLPPSVTITAPADGSDATIGDTVTLTGSALDLRDGDLSAAIAWSSSLDGALGTGASVSIATLSLGTHTITAQVTDSNGLSGAAQISLRVRPLPVTLTLISIAGEDGWVREAGETSGVGDTASASNAGKNALRIGDSRQDEQLKAIVSFDTSAIPDGAEVQSAILRLTRGGSRGGDPWTQPVFGALSIDVAPAGGFGGNAVLEDSDFEATAAVSQSGTMSVVLNQGEVSEGSLDAAGRAAVDVAGVTQLRLAFAVDDDDDRSDDMAGFYPGENGNASRRPALVIVYQE
ncbi:MAG: Ig-like domain-containing protein [Acidobacteriota bacterium]